MTIYLPYKNQKIGLGGIGKGYAVDRAFEYLEEKGLKNFSVNGSGDMRVHSEDDAQRHWKIGIRNPLSKNKDKSAGLVQVKNRSVSTSGSYIQNKNNDLKDHHIVNRYTREGQYPISCTIVGENCLETDTWATIGMTQEISASLELLNSHSLCGVLIDNNGKSYLTQKAMNYFGR